MQDPFPQISMRKKSKILRNIIAVFLSVVVVVFFWMLITSRPPKEFVSETIVTIPEGVSIQEAGTLLEQAKVIRSSSLFQFLVKTALKDHPIIAGDFQFDAPGGALDIARILTAGKFGRAQVKITIPEGASNVEIARIIKKAIPTFNEDEFLLQAKSSEGMLFPETYHIFKTIGITALLDRFKGEYEEKIEKLRPDIEASGKKESEIIIMASLLEKEAKNAAEAKIISGILWKRLKIGMPLQVDAPFFYVFGTTNQPLTLKDLRKDGPYNTYTRKGLPVGPIGNPGVAMINAAIHPEPSPYLYYLHGNDGQIRYGRTGAEHLANKAKYLK